MFAVACLKFWEIKGIFDGLLKNKLTRLGAQMLAIVDTFQK